MDVLITYDFFCDFVGVAEVKCRVLFVNFVKS